MNFKKASALCEERLRPYQNISSKKWGRAHHDLINNLCLVCDDSEQWAILAFWFSRLFSPHYGSIPSLHETAIGTRQAYSTVRERVSYMASDREGRGPLLLRTIERGKQTGIDIAPALAAIDRVIAQQEKKKRSHHAQRPALVASIAAQQPDQASAPASMEQPAAAQPIKAPTSAPRPPARSKKVAAQRPGQQEQQAPRPIEAPALPDDCIAALVAFLDAQELRSNREKDIAALVALTSAQRAGLDDSALLVALQRATAQASADIARRGKAIASPFGLLTHKIKEALAQQEQELADQARRIDAQQEQQKDMLAGLDENGQRFYAYGGAHNFPAFRYGRLWLGVDDWLLFAHLSDDATKDTVLRSIEAPAGAAQERPAETDLTICAPIGANETIATDAPARIEAPGQQEQPAAPAPAPSNVTPIGSRVNSRKELMKTAAHKGYPAIRLPGAGLIVGSPDAWERFSNTAEHKNIQAALRLLAMRPDKPDEGSAPARPIGPAPAPAPSSEAPDQGAQERGMIAALIDRAANSRPARWANDSAAGLL